MTRLLMKNGRNGIKMTVQELISALLEMPMGAEVVKSYSVEDEDGEEWTVEDDPRVYQASDKKVWL